MNSTKNQKLFPSERQKKIRRIALEKGILRISELADNFAVSEMTIRRDLEILEDSGFVERTFGGAILSEQASFELSYSSRLESNVEAKKAIAKYAASLIYDGDTIALDSSTTALALAEELQDRKITVLSNSLGVAQLLRSARPRLILSGGYLRQLTGGFVGPLALKTIADLRIDHAFISSKGLILNDALFDSDLDEIEVKRAMINSAAKLTAIVDASKFARSALGKIIALSDIDLLITDNSIATKYLKELKEIGLNYHIARV